jgi:hypothetical protein
MFFKVPSLFVEKKRKEKRRTRLERRKGSGETVPQFRLSHTGFHRVGPGSGICDLS